MLQAQLVKWFQGPILKPYMELGLRCRDVLIFPFPTFLSAFLTVEHICPRHLMFAAPHQCEFDLILDVLDVNGSRRIGAPTQRLNDVVRQSINSFMNASR
jgi:hypothetical protein